jgi:hypothetical protein
MLVQKDGRWAFVSRKTRRPLAYYRGEGKPSEEWVRKQEQRVQYFKHLGEATYVGNIGFSELVKFHSKASPQQKKMLNSHIQNKKHKEFRDLIKHVTGVKLHKSVNEEIKPDILPKAGAGQWGTPELTRNYIEGTPGQKVKRFKRYIKNI